MKSESELDETTKARVVSRSEARMTGISRDTLIALHETEGVGRITIANILLYGAAKGSGSLRHVPDFLAGDWRDMGLSAKQAAAVVDNLREEASERRIRKLEERDIQVITYLDDEYPELLAQISDPPWVIYYKGNWELVRNPAIAIVGTRLATGYGRKVAEDLGAGCAQRMTVVSGLARGVDTAAHLGALHARNGTIAVVAGGVDHCYPPENKALYRDLLHQGLILSESPPDTILHPGLFPLRNRIIVGLSYGVIVVEAAHRSGALITADLALGYNRDVFVVPGQITSPRSKGALEYFRKGAHPVLDESDIFEMYAYRLPPIPSSPKAADAPEEPVSPSENLTPDELRLYRILLEKACSIDELAKQSGMTFGHLHSVLLSLLIKRRIHQQPGSVYHVL
ncbi:DNA-processing protein DprA [Cohnella cholangitidis]|uniref:DNA-protecting protein DprA n=1 Tax=Cohnella cholangitidis TaxID=2598458 RepID=A0A7G5BT98_9BACL|nr:DNA-processing protein DprA [Cohnella cholangitidis]QMV40182.1 DNA-protecting protein DprA [Cohnella cholangitidis]